MRVVLLLVFLGCGGVGHSGGRATQESLLFVDCPVADATVWVNDKYVAPVASVRGGMALLPGSHRIEVRHDSFHTFYAEVQLAGHDRKRVAVELAPVIP